MSKNKQEKIKEILQEVYDPDFPFVDLYNLGLIYDIQIEKNNIFVVMTFTSPACPSADLILSMVKQAISEEYPDDEVHIDVVFEPMWTPDMIKDDDLKRMFE